MKIISQKEYQSRRNNLLDKMKDNSILLIPGEKEKIRNNDVHYEFRQNSDFWYFSGIEEADATLILLKKGSKKYILFIQEKKVEEEVWTGYRIGAEKAESFYLADEAYSNKDVEKLSNLIFECENIYYNLGSSKDLDKLIHNGLENFNRTKSRTGTPNPMIIDPMMSLEFSQGLSNVFLNIYPSKEILGSISGYSKSMIRTAIAVTKINIKEVP